MVKQKPEPGLLWSQGTSAGPSTPHPAAFFFPFSEHTDVQIQSIPGVSDRNGTIVLLQRVMALTLFWNHVGVILWTAVPTRYFDVLM